ncbi:phage terminase large subunit family protein [Candidatus Poribacteria bacterium]|nr:phage terminase large subunit family protein [Candidatus Poribacteria bacterium]
MTNFSFTPPADQLPSEWAEQNVHIPAGNARPGLISFDEMAYQREMLDVCADPDIQRVTLMLGAQTSKTTTSISLMFYYTLHKPRSQAYMMPSQDDLRKWLETKFNRMVDANDALRGCYAEPRGREGVNNQIMKTFKGGDLTFSWAGSPRTMRGISAPIICCDEVDGYTYTAEGHPVSLLWERSATFGDDRLLIEMSTPTTKDKSWIESAYMRGDCRKFFVICPACGDDHTIEWTPQTVRWKEGQPKTARLHCPKCDKAFDDYERIALIRNAERDGGGWRAARKTEDHASFHLNSLYSPFRRLAHIVSYYEEAVEKQDLQTFTNTILAQTWEEVGEKTDYEELYHRGEIYEAEIPTGVLVLTAGVDIQADRIEYEVVGWGVDEESWSIDYVVIYGDTTQNDVYRRFLHEIKRTYKDKNGRKYAIAAAGIDTGYNTGKVYDCIRQGGSRPILFAFKGKSGWNEDEVRRTSRMKVEHGKFRPDIITVGVDVCKQVVMRRLNLLKVEDVPTPPGYCHFPHDRDLEYYLQLTAEHKIRTFKRGFPQDVWEKRYERNEAFDCRVYAYACLKIMNPKLEAGQVYEAATKPRTLRRIRNPRV